MKIAGALFAVVSVIFAIILIAMMHAFLSLSFQGNWWMLFGFAAVFIGCCVLICVDAIRERNRS